MELAFSARGILERGKGLTFNDVLLVPQYSEISSRREPVLRTDFTRNYQIDIPVVTANMDTVTESEMVFAMSGLGGAGILHRFMSCEAQTDMVGKIKDYFKLKNISLPVVASIGVKEDGKKRASLLVEAGTDILTIDIAHGDSIMMLETMKYVKKNYPGVDVIAGNVATADGVKRMIDNGADAVKVGIGPGSMCTTRIITGHGVPQMTAVSMCATEARKQGIPVIADGGIKTSGDIIKALAAGANCVMLGAMVSGTLETPGRVKHGKKCYRGMASKEAQVSWRGELPKGMAAEGESNMISCKGSVVDVIGEVIGGIRSGMTYMGVDRIEDMYEKALFMEMTPAGF